MVVWDVRFRTGTTSNHLEWASTTTKNCFPRKGPAKSMWMRAQGRVGHFEEWRGAGAGDLRLIWHLWQSFTILSRSASIPGHHAMLRARLFIRHIPGCPSCSSLITAACPVGEWQLRFSIECTHLGYWVRPSDQWMDGAALCWRNTGHAVPYSSVMTTGDHDQSTAWSGWQSKAHEVCPKEELSLLVVEHQMMPQEVEVYLEHLHWYGHLQACRQ